MPILHPEDFPQQRLGGHPSDGAHLQGTAVEVAGDDLHEPSQERADQIGSQRIGRSFTAADDHIGQQRQSQRVAVGQLDQLVVTVRFHATAVQVPAAVLRAQVAQRHHPQQLAPRRVGAPGRARRLSPGEHRERSGWQRRQQHRADPVVQRRQPLIGVEQDHQTTTARRPGDGAVVHRQVERLPQDPQHRRRRRGEVAPVQADHRRVGVGGDGGEDIEQGRLADAWWSVEVQQHEGRFRRLEREAEQLELRRAAHEPVPPSRRQQVADRAGRAQLGHRPTRAASSRSPVERRTPTWPSCPSRSAISRAQATGVPGVPTGGH